MMEQRISMNTESLQNNFPDIYKDFFVKNIIYGCMPMVHSGGPLY